MKVCALMIGRGGSSLANKNVLPVLDVPLLLWGAAASNRSKYISDYYVSSDDQKILDTAAIGGFKPIRRPDELASATAQSCDAVKHALDLIESEIGKVDILVVQHANVGTITEVMIDECIDLLIANPLVDSVVPSHDKAEYHPMRAKQIMPDGSLSSFFSGPISANRQDLPKAVFFDHSFWVLRGRDTVFNQNGQSPWPCMGSNILPYVTEGCLDVHDIEDLDRTANWIKEHGIPKPHFTMAGDVPAA